MAKAYLIGGTPRCGKTSIALGAVKQHPMFSTSTDSIRYILRDVVSKEENPDLFAASEKFTEEAITELCTSGRASEIITWQNQESKIVWKSVKQCIEGFISEDLDILIEGVAVLPEFLAELTCDYTAVFIGNTHHEHPSRMLEFARSGSYDWMSKFNDETILKFGQFTKEFSEFIKEESTKYGYQYIEMGTNNYDKSKKMAISTLLAGI